MELLDLGVTLVLQESCVTCGPAVARMVQGRSIKPEAALVDIIGKFMDAHPDGCFETSPEAMADVLSSTTGREFRVARSGTIDEANRLIVGVLMGNRMPVPVLISGCDHWIVASGMVFSESPNAIDISTFIISDPFNPCLDCNMNNAVTPICREGRYRGAIADKVPATEWRQSWFTGCTCSPDGNFVCVVPNDAVPIAREVNSLIDVDPGPGLDRNIGIIDLPRCLEAAKARYDLNAHPAFARAIAGAQVLKALRVQGLGGGDYYLTEVGKPGAVTALFLFDDESGGFKGAKALQHPVPKFLPEPVDGLRQVVRSWRLRNNIELSIEDGLTAETPLSWSLTREFQSPYFPFAVLGNNAGEVYLGLNGALYSGLHKARA